MRRNKTTLLWGLAFFGSQVPQVTLFSDWAKFNESLTPLEFLRHKKLTHLLYPLEFLSCMPFYPILIQKKDKLFEAFFAVCCDLLYDVVGIFIGGPPAARTFCWSIYGRIDSGDWNGVRHPRAQLEFLKAMPISRNPHFVMYIYLSLETNVS